MTGNEELDIIRKVVSGDHDAFRALFMKYYPKLKSFIAHMVKSEDTAEAFSQDIFMKIWENRTDLLKIRSFNSYLYKMARHISINYLEHKYIEESYLANNDHPVCYIIEGELEAKELEFLIKLIVNKMPEQRRRIYIMSREKNIKNKKIAEHLGITEKTVNNQLSLALKEIRKVVDLSLSFFL